RRMGCVRGKLAPQVADVELHLVAGGRDVLAPDELAELVLAQYLIRVTDEGGKEPVFEARQGDLTVVEANGAVSEGDAEPSVGVRLRAAASVSAKEHFDAGDQLLASERLDDVVVGSGLQPADALQLGVACRQHQHGDI